MHTSTRADRAAYPFHASTSTTFARPVRASRRTARRVPVLAYVAQFAFAVAALLTLAHYV